MLAGRGAKTVGSKKAMNGRVKSPTGAVNSSSTATSVCLKYRSTRYLSKCVEMAQRTGPEKAKTSQVMPEFCQYERATANGKKAASAGRNRSPARRGHGATRRRRRRR